MKAVHIFKIFRFLFLICCSDMKSLFKNVGYVKIINLTYNSNKKQMLEFEQACVSSIIS